MNALFLLLVVGLAPAHAGQAFDGLERLASTAPEAAGPMMDGDPRAASRTLPVHGLSGPRGIVCDRAGSLTRPTDPPPPPRRNGGLDGEDAVNGLALAGLGAAALAVPVVGIAAGALVTLVGVMALDGIERFGRYRKPPVRQTEVGAVTLVTGLGIAAMFFPPAALALGGALVVGGLAMAYAGIRSERRR